MMIDFHEPLLKKGPSKLMCIKILGYGGPIWTRIFDGPAGPVSLQISGLGEIGPLQRVRPGEEPEREIW